MRSFRIAAVLSLLSLVAGCAAAVPPPPRVAADQPSPKVPLTTVLSAVAQAPAIRALPADLTPSLATTAEDVGFDNEKCEAGPSDDRVEPCVFGDRASATDVVLYGDSHAGMWLPPLSQIAERLDWRVQFYGKPGCPTLDLAVWNQREQRVFTECDRFRDFVAGG